MKEKKRKKRKKKLGGDTQVYKILNRLIFFKL